MGFAAGAVRHKLHRQPVGAETFQAGQRLREINVHRGAAAIAALNLAAPAGLVMADVFATKKADAGRVTRIVQAGARR